MNNNFLSYLSIVLLAVPVVLFFFNCFVFEIGSHWVLFSITASTALNYFAVENRGGEPRSSK